MLTSSRADEWLETSKFRGENVGCEFPSRSPAIPCRALIVEPNMFLSFPNLPRSSSIAFKIKPNNEVVYRLTIQSQECMQRQSSSYLDLTSAIVDTKDCMSSSIYFNCCSCCVTANATMLCKTSRCWVNVDWNFLTSIRFPSSILSFHSTKPSMVIIINNPKLWGRSDAAFSSSALISSNARPTSDFSES